VIHVTHHAITRYQERVAAVGTGEARRRILAHERTLQIAADFGAPVVRTGDGVGFVVCGGAVTTVLSPNMRLGPVA
jgi:hypothetical protein